MDKRVVRERMRRKQRQIRRRKMMRLAVYIIAAVLVVVFVIRGIIFPIIHKDNKNAQEVAEVQAETAKADPDAAVRKPLKGSGDLEKALTMTPGWHEDNKGKWYQNTDRTYYAGGFQEIDGVTYSFDNDGYVMTGWVSKGVQDLYFNEDGSYNPNRKKTMIALTYDDGPGLYTDELLACLEENGAHATFFMLGQNVEGNEETIQKMAEIGCELGSHSWDHSQLTYLDLDSVADQFERTDNALIEACGQAATVARAPYGDGNSEIYNTVGKPFFLWSLDTLDWSTMNVDSNYKAVMEGDLTDGSIILFQDIHEPSVEASLKIIPELVEKGYKLVTVSELAEAKGVDLQYTSYSDFWNSSLEAGIVAGYEGNDISSSDEGTEEDYSDEASEEA